MSEGGWLTQETGNQLWATKELEDGNTLISYINQAAVSTTIQSSKINLEGAVTMTALDKMCIRDSVATGRQSGGKIDVRRAQAGKLFPNSDYDPDARGFIDHPTVIVGEGPAGQSKEWVASHAAVSNPTVAPILDILDKDVYKRQ